MITLLSLIFVIPLIVVLLLSAKEDLKSHEVSLKKQVAIALLSIPLIIINWNNINIVHFIFIFMAIILYKLGMGGADLKILILLSLTLTLYQLMLFTIGFNILGLVHGILFKSKTVALVPAIAFSYFFIIGIWI